MTHQDLTASGGRLRVSRSRGAVPGVLLIVLGAWGALAPLVTGYINFGFTPEDTWNVTNARWWLEILPGIVVVVGGLLLLLGADRIITSLGGWLAAAGGAWFAIGTTVQPATSMDALGDPIHTSSAGAMAERLALTVGLSVVIVFVAAWALGALAVVGIRDVRHARDRATLREAEADRAIDVRRRDVATDPVPAERTAAGDEVVTTRRSPAD